MSIFTKLYQSQKYQSKPPPTTRGGGTKRGGGLAERRGHGLCDFGAGGNETLGIVEPTGEHDSRVRGSLERFGDGTQAMSPPLCQPVTPPHVRSVYVAVFTTPQ
jgi:hypothetical protein